MRSSLDLSSNIRTDISAVENLKADRIVLLLTQSIKATFPSILTSCSTVFTLEISLFLDFILSYVDCM